MRQILLASIVFAILAALAWRRFRAGGLIVLAPVWAAAISGWLLASVPVSEVPQHDFERTPVPAIFATVAGTAAATAFAARRRRSLSLPGSILAIAAVYRSLAVLVAAAVTLWAMG